jgi:hypothetical protein
MKELLLTFYLLIPHPSLHNGIAFEQIPNQVQFRHEGGLQVSYPYKVNDCRTVTALPHEYIVKMRDEQVCYVINTNDPFMFRSSSWMSTHGRTHTKGE